MPYSLDELLRSRYRACLEESLRRPLEERAIAYDAAACETIASVGPFIKRLDPRRKLKQKTGTPDDSEVVRPSHATLVRPPIFPDRFNFTRVRAEERLIELELAGGAYSVLPNKYPACRCHLLLVARDLRPQVLSLQDLQALQELLGRCSFNAFYNSWSAAASVNHLHFQLLDDDTPLLRFPIQPAATAAARGLIGHASGFPACHQVFPASALGDLWQEVQALLDSNQPHNLFWSSDRVYLFPRNPDPRARAKDILGEEMGALECAGVFTLYERALFDALSLDKIRTLLRLTTRPRISKKDLKISKDRDCNK